MQESRALSYVFPTPASSEVEAIAPFHLPSGEQGGWPLQGTLPLFTT
jgi:hypothetical protein